MPARKSGTVRVWDPLVRVSHWLVAAAFFVCYLTEDDLLSVHVWAGYLIGGLVVVRVVWGFVGPRHARFADFVYPPRTVVPYLIDLVRWRARRYLGHSPAGGAMSVALLVALVLTVVSGIALYGADDKAGPLAPLFAGSPAAAGADSRLLVGAATHDDHGEEEENENENENDDGDDEGGGEREGDESPFAEALEEAHEVLADLTLALVFAHVIGVLLASFAHRENLVRSMITGDKRRDGGP